MITLYKDKPKNFECSIKVDGASLNEAKARVILENSEYNVVFDGKIDSNGNCVVPIKNLKMLSEGLTGTLKLEVIIEEDTYFLPYQEDFKIEQNKKVTVEVKESQPVDDKKKVIVEVKDESLIDKISNTNSKREVINLLKEDLMKFKLDKNQLLEVKNILAKKRKLLH